MIDIGSNSVRLVVYEGAVRSPTPLFNEKVLCGLGRALASTGRLADDNMARALAALTRFRLLAELLQVKKLRAIATAAVREADNGGDFIALGEAAGGCPIEVLSGEQEAALAADGIRMGFFEPDGLVGDLGGGSLELIDLADDDADGGATTPLGVLRLMELSGGKVDKARGHIDKYLDAVSWLDRGKGRPFFAVGGSWRALARLHMESSRYPLHVMHGFTLAPPAALKAAEKVRKSRNVASLRGIERVSKARREGLPFAALLFEQVLARLQPSEVVFSAFGIREGLLYSMLPDSEKLRDPLVSFCHDYARLRSRSHEHAEELRDWTDRIFVAPGPDENDAERRLRHAACLLSDIGWRAHPDYRGDQSLFVVAHAALSGVQHSGRVFLALAIYFRHEGSNESDDGHLSEQIKALVSDRLLHRAAVVGAAIRVAHMLSAGMPGIVRETRLLYEQVEGETVLSLVLPRRLEALNGERIGRRMEKLARLLGFKPVIRVGT